MIECTATTLFCDIINSTQIANILGSRDYHEFILEFYHISDLAKREFLKNVKVPERKQFIDWQVRGDEICIIFYSPLMHYDNPAKLESLVYDDIQDALKIAVNLKLKWWSSLRNRKRIDEQKKVFDLGIGIHSGLVSFDKKKNGKFSKPIGYSISVAKRVESLTRQGKFSKIMLSQSVHQYLREKRELRHIIHLVSAGLMSAKGVDDILVYEVRSFRWFSDFFNFANINHGTVESFHKEFRQNPQNIWIGNLLANIKYQKMEFEQANRIFQQLAEIDETSADFHNNVGVTYTLMAQNKKNYLLLAEDAIKKAINIENNNPEFYFNLANLYYRMDNFRNAYTNIAKTLALDENYPNGKELYKLTVDSMKRRKIAVEDERYET